MASSGELKDFFLKIGFAVDEASRKKVQQTVAKNEAGLTATTIAELERRRAAEEKMLTQRVEAITSVGGELEAEEKAHAARLLKIHQDQGDKDRKRDEGEAKKAIERRAATFKSLQTFALNAAALAAKAVTAVEGVAVGIGYAVNRAASRFEGLNYAAQRSASSARGLTAFSYAASQLGSSVDEAGASLAKFGDNLKRLPGYENMLRRLGVQTRDAQGKLRDSAEVASDLGGALRTMRDSDPKLGYAKALAYGNTLGFDENTTRSLMDPRFKQFEQEREAQQDRVGLDANKAGREGADFEQSMRRFKSALDDISDKITTDLFGTVKGPLDEFSGWLTKHSAQIAQHVSSFARAVIHLARAFVKSDLIKDAVTALSDGFEKLSVYIGSDDFKKDMKSFADGIGRIARAVVKGLQLLHLIPDTDTAKPAGPTPGSKLPENQSGLRGLAYAAMRGRGDMPAYARARAGHMLNRLLGRDTTHISDTGPRSRGVGRNFNQENADAIVTAAKQLGTTPEDLATVIGYETGGTFSPSKWGGRDGHYMGLIQFGGPERAQYGAYEGQSFKDQMGAVVRYLKGRGFKPGMGLKDLYSTINAGSPGHYNASDGNGTVSSHVENMQGAAAAQARAMLALASKPTPSPDTQVGGKERLPPLPPKAMYWATLPDGRRQAVDAQGRAVGSDGRPTTTTSSPFGTLDPNAFKTAPVTSSSPASLYQSYDNSRSRGDTSITHNPTYNITGGDPHQNLAAARLSASRGQVDLLRNIQGSEQ